MLLEMYEKIINLVIKIRNLKKVKIGVYRVIKDL